MVCGSNMFETFPLNDLCCGSQMLIYNSCVGSTYQHAQYPSQPNLHKEDWKTGRLEDRIQGRQEANRPWKTGSKEDIMMFRTSASSKCIP